MKILNLIIITLCSILAVQNDNAKQEKSRIVFFSTVEFVETPLSYIKGSVPLSEEVALTRNHYRFTYDQFDRVKTIAFYNGETPKEPNQTANLFTLAHKMTFSYQKGIEEVKFYDRKGTPKAVLGECHTFHYILDELGFRTSLYFLDKDEKRIENSWNIYKYQWDYQEDGAVIEERYNEGGEMVAIRPGFEFYRLKLYFNPLGHIALMKQIDGDGNLVENASGAAQDRITTNAQGNFLRWQVLNKDSDLEKGNGPNVAIGIQEFDEFGYEVSLIHLDEAGEVMCSEYGICRSETRFDKFGNITERAFFDKEGQASLHQEAGYHRFVIKWDESGNYRQSISYFDIDHKPTAHRTRGYQNVKYEYDEVHNLIKLTYLDEKGTIVNRLDNGIAYMTYDYDFTGNLIKTVKFNKDGITVK